MTEPGEQIIVRVSPDGAVVAETRGVKGPRCLDYINLLEDLLDAQATDSAFTEAYFETPLSTHDEVSNDLHQR